MSFQQTKLSLVLLLLFGAVSKSILIEVLELAEQIVQFVVDLSKLIVSGASFLDSAATTSSGAGPLNTFGCAHSRSSTTDLVCRLDSSRG